MWMKSKRGTLAFAFVVEGECVAVEEALSKGLKED